MTPLRWSYTANAHFYTTLKQFCDNPQVVRLLTELFEAHTIEHADQLTHLDPKATGYREAWSAIAFSRYLPPDVTAGTELPLRKLQSIITTNEWANLHCPWLTKHSLGYRLPAALRSEHTQIIAKSGHGKTQLFQSLILDNLDEDAAIVVIDSQRDMINTLAPRVDPKRLILVDPRTCPPALNIFAREGSVEDALGMYEYIFSALDAELTSMQLFVYRQLARLCLAIPGANLSTLAQLLEPDGTDAYQEYIDELPEHARSFFAEYGQKRSQYTETKQRVLRRVQTVLERDAFAKMLNAPQNRLELKNELDRGKIILVSTDTDYLKDAGPLLGRIFVAEVLNAVMSRQGKRKRVYLYVDEWADYAQDTPTLINLFKQSRKYNCATTIAHQELADLTPKLAATIATNTSIKMVGRVSASDRNVLARELRTTPDTIDLMQKGEYLTFIDGHGLYPYRVEFGKLEALPEQQPLPEIQERMRRRYGPRLALPKPDAPVATDEGEDEW